MLFLDNLSIVRPSRKLMKLFLYLLILFTPFLEAESQQFPLTDQKKIDSDITLALNTYQRVMNGYYDLINGKEYLVYHKVNHSNPFFKTATVASGCVYAYGRSFCDFRLIYDIFKDEIIVNFLNPSGYLKLASLNQHFVDSFDISINNITSRFNNLSFKQEDGMKDGFYEIGYRGKTTLLVKHAKVITQVNSQDEYIDKLSRYLYINGKYHLITSKGKFCKLFGEKRPMIRKYIKLLQIIPFREISDADLLEVLAYYDQINKS